MNVSESDFTFIGELESFIPYLLQKTDKMYVRGDLNSSTMLFSELMTIKDISKGKNLTFDESKFIFLSIMSGNISEDLIFKFLINLSKKGETADEIAGNIIY